MCSGGHRHFPEDQIQLKIVNESRAGIAAPPGFYTHNLRVSGGGSSHFSCEVVGFLLDALTHHEQGKRIGRG